MQGTCSTPFDIAIGPLYLSLRRCHPQSLANTYSVDRDTVHAPRVDYSQLESAQTNPNVILWIKGAIMHQHGDHRIVQADVQLEVPAKTRLLLLY